MQEHDHIIYCSAGNGMWKQCWDDVVKNVNSFDTRKVTVVLLGTADYWAHVAGELAPNMNFLEDAKNLLQSKHVQVAEMTTAVLERLEYVDAEGHPTQESRWLLADQLVEVFQSLIKCELVGNC